MNPSLFPRIILHVDMDAFFASVEQRDNPALRRKPIAVIGASQRTVLVSPSYEARAYGIKTGMNVVEAKRILPSLIFVKASHGKYTRTCEQIVKILYGFSPDLEVYSIDECFIDITGVSRLWGDIPALELAGKIKQKIRQELKLICSIGIAPNKLLAKLASSHHKPDGLFEIKDKDIAPLLRDLPVEELWGIGKRTKEVLNSIGIYSCSDLACADPLLLRKRFGIFGECLREMGQGKDSSSVMPYGYEPKARSVGHSMTLPYDICSKEDILKHILELSDMVSRRMRREGFLGKTVAVVFRYNDFQTFSRQKKMAFASDDTRKIYTYASMIVKNTLLEKPIRLLGVSVSGLERSQEELFLFEEDRRVKRLNKTLDLVNERFGSAALTFAALLENRSYKGIISPSWRPYGVREYK